MTQISKPIGIAQLASLLGSGSRDVGFLCTHPNINKWAKHKPIRYAKWGALTDEEFKGNVTDRNNGILYGIRFTEAVAGHFEQLHGITFSYVGMPSGGASEPYRLLDFDGYDTNALPNVNGQILWEEEGEAYYDVNTELAFRINITSDNISIDIREVFESMLGYSLANSYPCLVISNATRTANYICGLKSKILGETDAVRPLYYNGQWILDVYADFQYSNGFPLVLQDVPLVVTMFLIPNLGAGRTFPIDGKWHSTSMSAYAERGCPLPEGVNNPIIVKRWDDTPVLEPNGTYFYNRESAFLQFPATYESTPIRDVYLEVSVTPVGGGGFPRTKQAVHRLGQILLNPTFTLSELGFIAGGQYSVDVVIRTGRQAGPYPNVSDKVRINIDLR